VDFGVLATGLVVGLSIAAPVGPIGVLCIRRTLAEGRLAGLVSGLGAATADAFYGLVGALGLTFVSGFLLRQQTWLRLVGGLFLLVLGARIFLAGASDAAARAPDAGGGLLAAYTSTLVLTLTNPITILFFAGIFAGLGLAGRGDYGAAVLLVTGVFLGSALWWVTLSGVVSLLRARFNARALRWVNRVSGIVVAGFGVAALLSLAG
jgi:threonine/homoserine/homoserine lactone efflux protein